MGAGVEDLNNLLVRAAPSLWTTFAPSSSSRFGLTLIIVSEPVDSYCIPYRSPSAVIRARVLRLPKKRQQYWLLVNKVAKQETRTRIEEETERSSSK